MRKAIAVLLFVFAVVPASAGLPQYALKDAGAFPPPGARLDLRLTARDTSGHSHTLSSVLGGRPAFVTFVDYTCNTLCSTSLQLLVNGIETAHLDPSGFRIVVIGIDPKDPARAAIAMQHAEIPASLRASTVFLLPDKAVVEKATTALGFRYAYDAAADQFAHPAVVYTVAADGRVLSLLSPFALTTADLGTAFENRTVSVSAGLLQHAGLLCYAYDPATGIYSLRIDVVLKLAAVATILIATALIGMLIWRGRRAS